jgi:hypothetical protein
MDADENQIQKKGFAAAKLDAASSYTNAILAWF